jgi:phosphoglycolate phosphatase
MWDWNGTLPNDAEVSWEAFNRVLKARHVPPMAFANFREHYQHPIAPLYHKAGLRNIDDDIEDIAREWHEYFSLLQGEVSLHSDAIGVLDFFKARGIIQCVLSALDHTRLQRAVSAFGLSSYFWRIYGLKEGLSGSKISRAHELFLECQVVPGECLVIGDSCHDAEVAEALGAECILVARGLQTESKLLETGFPVVDTLLGVQRLFDF